MPGTSGKGVPVRASSRKAPVVLLPLAVFLLLLLFTAAASAGPAFKPGNLPVLSLSIDGGQEAVDAMNESEDHSVRCSGRMDLDVPSAWSGPAQDSLSGVYVEYIRGRGNTTWFAEKKPYKIKFSKKQDLFGLGASKHWILLANYYDNSMLRNHLTFWLGSRMNMPYTPGGVFVDVVMEGRYIGCYYLCEQVRIEKNRVDIDELTRDVTSVPDLWGGYLLSLYSEISEDTPEADLFTTDRGATFVNANPSFDTAGDGYDNPAQRDYIRAYVGRTEDALFAEDGRDADGKHYTDLLDISSVVDNWWVQELCVNQDALGTDSSYLYKPRFEPDGTEGKLYFGPLWDFDLSWGNNMYYPTVEVTGFNHANMPWLDQLRQRPGFVRLLKDRWAEIDSLLEEAVRSGGFLDQCADQIRTSWLANHDLYGAYLADPDEENPEWHESFDAEVEALRSWIIRRRAWVNGHLDELGEVFCVLTTRGTGIETRTESMYRGTSVYLPYYRDDLPEDRVFIGWYTETGVRAPDDFVLNEDTVLTARFEGEDVPLTGDRMPLPLCLVLVLTGVSGLVLALRRTR